MKHAKTLALLAVACMLLIISACTNAKTEIIRDIEIGDMRVAVEKTGDSTAKVVLYQSGESKDIYEIDCIDPQMICYLNHYGPSEEDILGKETLWLSYYRAPSEEDIYNHDFVYIIFDIEENDMVPVAIGKDSIHTGDYDGDGVIEVITNYDALGTPRTLVYDNINGKIRCADPEWSFSDLYGIPQCGAHEPYEVKSDGRIAFDEAVFESNKYAGVKLTFSDLEFKEPLLEKFLLQDLKDVVLHGKPTAVEPTEKEPVKSPDMGNNEILTGTVFVNFQIEPYRSNPSGNRKEIALPYELKLTTDGKIREAKITDVLTVWGTRCWDKADGIEGVDCLSQYNLTQLLDDWTATIAEDGKSVVFEGSIKVNSDNYNLETQNMETEWNISKYKFEILVP